MHDVYLWAETYRGTLEDIFEIQEKVAAEIVQTLPIIFHRTKDKISRSALPKTPRRTNSIFRLLSLEQEK